MQVGERAYGGIYVGDCDGNMIICSTIEYDLPFRVDWFQAVDYCTSVGMELPTKEELDLLYELYEAAPEYFPMREYFWYWTSTESSSTDAWGQVFPNGYQGAGSKSDNGYVRPIKRIKV